MISSEPLLSAADYLLYLRCPRSLHLRLIGAEPTEVIEYPVTSDRGAVQAVGRELFRAGDGFADEAAFSVEWTAAPFLARPDIYHTIRPEGNATVIIREATGLKRAYLRECAFLRYCALRLGHRLDRQYVYYVKKGYRRSGELDPQAMFVHADVTRRVDSIYETQSGQIAELAREIAEDPTLSKYSDLLCSRPYTCPVCSSDAAPLDDDHILTLYRGGDLARELLREGYTTIGEVPDLRLQHPRQHIQKAALTTGKPHIDSKLLAEFLSSLHYPIYYLDFEAVTCPIPPFDGIRPWEHVPYLYSVHRSLSLSDELEHRWFLAEPGHDERLPLLERLLADLDTSGSIVVYSAAFELSVLGRLADQFPEYRDSLEMVKERVVDLLSPFSDFAYYNHLQRGKVSLKSVLPAITEHDYSGLSIAGGLEANLAYRHLSENPNSANRERTLRDLVAYCGMDTLAMVRIVRKLHELAGAGTE